jgi:hypothetical protein
MAKKILGIFLILGLIFLGAVSSLAVLKGLEDGKQNIVKIGESVEIPIGTEVESAVSIGGSVTVYGRVLKDVVSVGGSVHLKHFAFVGGDVVAVGGKINREPTSVVKGDITEVSVPVQMAGLFTSGGIIKGLVFFSILSFIGFLLLVVILVALFTPQLGKVSSAIEKHVVKTFLVGLLVTLLVVPIIILLAISLVGIVFIPVWVVLVAAAGLFGYTGAAHFVGKKMLSAFKINGKSMMAEALTGVIVLSLIGLVPFIGFIIKAIVGCWGLGAVTLTKFGTVKLK